MGDTSAKENHIKYVPYTPDLDRKKKIVVDGGRSVGLNLSHWPDNSTPEELRADTSAEIVLNYLSSPDPAQYGQYNIVTNDHYDVDGVISVWMVLNPETALENSKLLSEAAITGDFDRFTTEKSLQLAVCIEAYGDETTSPVGSDIAATSDFHEKAAIAYRAVTADITDMLGDLDGYRSLWESKVTHIMEGISLLGDGTVVIAEEPDLDLAILETPVGLHTVARMSGADCDRVLTHTEGEGITLEYSYRTWVILHSKRPMPRINLEPLAAELNEADEAEWTCDMVQAIKPVLRSPSESILSWDTVRQTVVEYLRTGIQIPERLWHPYS